MKAQDLPKEIFFEQKVGSNGIHCLDYKNESNIKYIREDVVKSSKVKFIVYYLDERDFSENEMYADRRKLLQEVEDESRFNTKEEAIERAKSLVAKNIQVTILEVYSI